MIVDWKTVYAPRTSSERTTRYDQEVIANGHLPKLRGLQVFRFSGVIRTVGHMLPQALQLVLDVTSPLGKLPLTKT
jgi:hypothetical protein